MLDVPMRRLLATCLLLALALPSAAAARPSRDSTTSTEARLKKSRLLWATVNVCDTARHANTMGIRASMPAHGKRSLTLYMRFRAQYFAKADGKWHNGDKSSDSGWRRVGRARTGARESGYSFSFMPPSDGGAHMLRGAVSFEWRNTKGRAVYRVRELTGAGHKSRVGADPPGFSAGGCEIK